MKSELFVQYGGNQIDTKQLLDIAKETWKAEGNKEGSSVNRALL